MQSVTGSGDKNAVFDDLKLLSTPPATPFSKSTLWESEKFAELLERVSSQQIDGAGTHA